MEQFVDANLSTYGPLAVFLLLMLSGVGIALGEEMVTIPAGVLIATGQMNFLVTAVCAYVGIVLADFLWFGICHHLGTRLLHMKWSKRLIHPRRLLEAKHQFDSRGVWFIVIARFIPSSRTTAITVAGMFQMPFWQFAAATASCVLITVPVQLGLGYLIGIEFAFATENMADLLLKTVGLVMVIVAVTLLFRWWTLRRASKCRPPRAKMSWLKRFHVPHRKRRLNKGTTTSVEKPSRV